MSEDGGSEGGRGKGTMVASETERMLPMKMETLTWHGCPVNTNCDSPQTAAQTRLENEGRERSTFSKWKGAAPVVVAYLEEELLEPVPVPQRPAPVLIPGSKRGAGAAAKDMTGLSGLPAAGTYGSMPMSKSRFSWARSESVPFSTSLTDKSSLVPPVDDDRVSTRTIPPHPHQFREKRLTQLARWPCGRRRRRRTKSSSQSSPLCPFCPSCQRGPFPKLQRPSTGLRIV